MAADPDCANLRLAELVAVLSFGSISGSVSPWSTSCGSA